MGRPTASERWEEQSGFSPSTISAEIAGLTAAAKIASVNHDSAHARLYQATADEFARKIKTWTVTTTGPYAPRYFIRVSKTGDPNAAISYSLGNGSITADQRSIVDAGFLELVRLGILPARDADIRASLGVIDKTIERQTNSGPGWYRYGTSDPGSEDGYGDCWTADHPASPCPSNGAPWPPTDTGSGHLWPVLSGERGEYDIASGQGSSARTLLTAMQNMTSGQGLEPEQVWEDPDLAASPFGTNPATASIGFTNGKPVGSASPLTWAQATVARLTLDLGAGRNLETPDIVSDRYVAHGMPGALPLTITSPAPGTTITTPSITVTGTTAPHALVDAEAETPAGGAAATGLATADGSGHWSLTLTPTGIGSPTITVTATKGNSTGYAQELAVDAGLPGTNVLTAMDPSGDDNGPGTYQYPTDRVVPAGSVRRDGPARHRDHVRRVHPDGAAQPRQHVRQRLRRPDARRLRPQPVGHADLDRRGVPAAQLHDRRGRRLDPADRGAGLRAAGVGQLGGHLARLRPAHHRRAQSHGDPRAAARRRSAIRVSGWVFTVALTGQDGFSPDQARTFAATPQPFNFGVCASGGTSPDLLGQSEHGPQGDGHDHPERRVAGRRAQPAQRAGAAAGHFRTIAQQTS